MPVALLDACVLYPPAVRDLFMWLAAELVYQPRWTDAIHEEWIRSVLENRADLTREHLERTRRLMDRIHPECLVSGYESRIQGLFLPDADDHHVLAAAIHAGAGVIVTFNLSDFPEAALALHGVRAMHPDKFLIDLLDERPALFLEAIRKHRASLRRPPKTPAEYIQTLRANRLGGLASRLDALALEF